MLRINEMLALIPAAAIMMGDTAKWNYYDITERSNTRAYNVIYFTSIDDAYTIRRRQ